MPILGLFIGLIRPDGVIIGVTATLIGLALSYRNPKIRKKYLIFTFIAFIGGTTYFIWRYQYFGYLLPLPLYVKSTAISALPGLKDHFHWASKNVALLIITLYMWIFSTNRKQILIAATPVLVLLLALTFATQSQNIAHRFQAPATTIAILIIAHASSSYYKLKQATTNKQSKKINYITIFFSILILANNIKYLHRNIHDLINTEYINYLPFHLASDINYDFSIALTEAGRFAYWMPGKKYDLVGLNTPETATKGSSTNYLKRINPDLFFIHVANTANLNSTLCKKNFCQITLNQLNDSITDHSQWSSVSYGVHRAPLVVYDYLNQYPNKYILYAVRYYSNYYHLYALKQDSPLTQLIFEKALNKSFDSNYHLSYINMKKLHKNIFLNPKNN